MKIYLIDDDTTITNILRLIIHKKIWEKSAELAIQQWTPSKT